ncbi:hypothetical protein [Sphingomonas oryzagri]
MAYVDTRPHEVAWNARLAAGTAIRAGAPLTRVERDVLLASRRDRVSGLVVTLTTLLPPPR